MGNCAGPAGPAQGACNGAKSCQYRLYDAPANDMQYKMNALVNYFCGFQTAQDILNFVNDNRASGSGYNSIYPLIFPPAMEYIPAVNIGVQNDGTSRLLNSDEYTMVPNPFWDQAQVIQKLMFGQSADGAMPCQQWYYVPFSYTGESVPQFENVLNPSYCQCLVQMYNILENPLPGSNICVDGIGATLPSIVYSYQLVQNQLDTMSSAILQCLTPYQGGTGDSSQCIKVLFEPYNMGPYDISVTAPCVGTGSPEPAQCSNVNSPTCTAQICNTTASKGGWNCTLTGLCIPVPAGGTFSSQAECAACQANGNCPGSNICCPEAQPPNQGICSAANNPPQVTYGRQAIIGLAVIAGIVFLIGLAIWYAKRKKVL
jgi:hypothetical protein